MPYYKRYKKLQQYINGVPVEPPVYEKGDEIAVYDYEMESDCEKNLIWLPVEGVQVCEMIEKEPDPETGFSYSLVYIENVDGSKTTQTFSNQYPTTNKFNDDQNIKKVKVNVWQSSPTDHFSECFQNCNNLEEFILINKVNGTFASSLLNCPNLKYVDLGWLDTAGYPLNHYSSEYTDKITLSNCPNLERIRCTQSFKTWILVNNLSLREQNIEWIIID